ncbi:MAG: hypothetical protein M3362_02905 [Acidobacteriota bacterium]|nr:hypothetical protein [Acidobacteriota bacterium]
MSKTIVSVFDDHQKATHLVSAAAANGFDSHLFSVINPAEAYDPPQNSVICKLPGIPARLYRKHLRSGDSLLVAQVTEDDVPRLIKLLQSIGGHDIEAFDQVNAA